MNRAISSTVDQAEQLIESYPQRLANFVRPYSTLAASIIGAIHIDSPFTTLFVFACFMVQLFNVLFTPLQLSQHYFGIPPFSHFTVTSLRSWFCLISHVLGHGSWSHLNGNVVNLLLVGPAVERHFGGRNVLKIIFYVALSSGVAHMLFGPGNSIQLGASGVVFSFILLNSLIEISSPGATGAKGRIPLTFVFQICLWVNSEVISQFMSSRDEGISHVSHLVGALVGTYFGYKMHPPTMDAYGHSMGRR